MDGQDYVWIVSHDGYSDGGGFYCFSSAHAAGAELERRGVGWRMGQHRIWDAPLMGAGAHLRTGFKPLDSEPCGLCGGDGLARRMQFSSHGASMRRVVITDEPCPRCR